jgi:hypothetical protein
MTQPLHCWNCGARLASVPLPLSRHDYCPNCSEALHCCRQCMSWSTDAPGQCLEHRAEPPTNKESANFCEWFTLNAEPARASGGKADAARARLDALFGPRTEEDPSAGS